MVNKTKIEWCDYTANPIRYRRADDPTGQRGPVWACVKASEGCQNCYAESRAWRFQGREFTASAMRGVVPYVDEGELRSMLPPRRLPAGSRCFVGDMTDLFGPWVPFELLDRVFAVMALTPQHTYQVLTKRPDRMRAYVSNPVTPVRVDLITACMAEGARLPSNQEHADFQNHVANDPAYRPTWPLPNVWLGVSVENQHWADVRIPELLATPAAVRFVSCEPLLGDVFIEAIEMCGPVYGSFPGGDPRNFTPDRECCTPAEIAAWKAACAAWDRGEGEDRGPSCATFGDGSTWTGAGFGVGTYMVNPPIDWVIVGGESGPGARPCDVAWVRSVVSQCRAAGVACFVKQLGGAPRMTLKDWEVAAKAHDPEATHTNLRLRDRKGGDPAEWPEDLRVREMPR